jgi:hypothetical protein
MKHLNQDCLQIQGNCSFECGSILKRNEIEQHKEKCPKFKIKCLQCQMEGSYLD